MAMEKLYELHESQRYDLLVVDTPPTRSALDFLDAPDNLNELLDARAFRLLIAPAQRIGRGYLRGLNLATTAMTKMVRRVTGSELLAEVGEFFAAFEGMYDGFKERAGLVYDQLRHPSTAFVVVATPDGAALREAAYFAGRLAADRMPLGALVVNRIHQAEPVPRVPAPAGRRRGRRPPARRPAGAARRPGGPGRGRAAPGPRPAGHRPQPGRGPGPPARRRRA
jgi:anion-transporting  ArsA/GET3 family ATPase